MLADISQVLPIPEKSGWPWTKEAVPRVLSNKVYPKISIVTPSYNQGSFIEETIRSILLQGYPNLEYIIIDGGSTDNTLDIIKKYEPWLTYWISEPDKGQSEAINKGFRKCTGDIVTWMGSDDYLEEDALFTVAEKYEDSDWGVLSGNCIMFFEGSSRQLLLESNNITFNSLMEIWRVYFCPPQPAMFIRKSALDQAGYLDESLRYAMDYELWLRLSRKYSFQYVDQNFAYYRVHEYSKTGSIGGMEKFYPEWKYARDKYLSTATLTQKFVHYFSFSKYTFYDPIVRFLKKRQRGVKKRLNTIRTYVG